ncbi:MAG: ComF family protein [Clostridia bacterium]|nr:ComF family protein [Clostridia bacterium]MDD4686291.1 ComF family protein [Clostridia bacterium]
MKIKKFSKIILDIIYPTDIKCIFCGDELDRTNYECTCKSCLPKLPYNNKQICDCCGVSIDSVSPICNECHSKNPPYYIARAPFEYADKIKNIINNFKYNNAKYLAKPLSQFMAKEYYKHNFNCQLIVFTPLSKEKLKERGYNQAELLANELAIILNLLIRKDIVIKVKKTLSQTTLNHAERKLNLENAFKIIDKKAVKNKNILLVDDVFTTGATITAISNLLKKSGAKVYVLTIAHTNLYRKV